MKLAGQKATDYFKSVETAPITLVFGVDETQARKSVQSKANAVLGEHAAEELRITIFDAKDIQKEPSKIYDAVKAISFFPGPVGIIIYGGTDALNTVMTPIHDEWQAGDAMVFIQAGNLTKASKLRKLLEPSKKAYVIGLYNDPLTAQTINGLILTRQLRLTGDAKAALVAFCLDLDVASAEQFLEGIALYQLSDEGETTLDEITKLLPGGYASAVDTMISFLLKSDAKNLVQQLRRAPGQGVSMHQIVAMSVWKIQALVKVKANPNPSQAMMTLRPPLFGDRRTEFENTLRRWSLQKLENALKILSDTERQLRSGEKHIPESAMVERNLLRICYLNRQ